MKHLLVWVAGAALSFWLIDPASAVDRTPKPKRKAQVTDAKTVKPRINNGYGGGGPDGAVCDTDANCARYDRDQAAKRRTK